MELDTGLPSIRKIQEFIKTKQQVELKLSTGDAIVGRVLWQDPQYLCSMDASDVQTIVTRSAIVYLKPVA
ncbi:MAG: RNA-binding protein hfq [Cyanobacteriota bacterium]|nr:RNA-binding protein hfq [Cyanobacteriota bacterium]